MFLTKISLKRPVLAIVIIIAMLAVGIVSFGSLSVNQYPDVDTPTINVAVVESNTSPDQIEANITKKVEDAVGEISGVKHITSSVSEGLSNTTIEFELEKSSDQAVQEVRDKVSGIRGDLPRDINEPIITKYDANAAPILSLAVTGNMSNKELSRLVDDSISKQLNTVKGVGAVNVYGDQEREIHIKIDKQKMNAFNLSTTELVNSLGSDNINQSSGKLSNGTTEIGIKTDAAVKSLDDFKNIIVAKRNGSEIKLGDVAEIEDGIKDKDSLSYYNGKETIGIDVVKQSGSNTVDVADAVKKEVAVLKASVPQGVNIDIVSDGSTSIRDSANDVEKTLVEGCILAVVIVFVFLKDLRSTGISAVALPISIITTFAVMKVLNFSINMMTLMGLSLAVGLLIDDAIVVIENVVRHLMMGKSPLQAAKDGTDEIGLAVIATSLSIAAVFIPFALTTGMVGRFAKQFGLTVAASVMISLFVSFTLVPLMSSKYLKGEGEKSIPVIGKFLDWFNAGFDKITGLYSKLLKNVLDHRGITVLVTIGLLAGSMLLATKINITFITSADMGQIAVTANLDSGMTLDNASKLTGQIEGIIKKNPDVVSLYSTVKKSQINITAKLKDKDKRKENIDNLVSDVRKDLSNIPGIDLSVIKSGGMIPGKALQYNIKGDDFASVQAYAAKAADAMRKIPGAADVSTSYKAGKPEVKLEVDRDKAADLGVSPTAVSNTLNILLNGSVVTHYQTDADKYDVKMQLKDGDRKDFSSLNGIYVTNSSGSMVPIDQVTKTVFATSASTINRYDKKRNIQLSTNYSGISESQFTSAFQKNLKAIPVPNGVTLGSGGTQEMMSDGFVSMATGLLMGILLIFLIISAQFESFVDPLAILLSLPLAIIGAILGLFLAHKAFDMMTGIGIIMLMGLVTKNAILLIDFAKQGMKEGLTIKEALLRAGHTRLRPIIMTTLAMIFGMIPTAIATGTGSEQRVSMAYAIIGGLITSTLLSLLFIPVVYTFLNDLKHLLSKKRKDSFIELETVNKLKSTD